MTTDEFDLHKASTLSPYIGQDFLTWLWFKTETGGGLFRLSSEDQVGVHMEQRISVQGGEGETKDTATSSGPQSELTEARLGLRTGKKVTQARLRIEEDENAWQLQLKAEDFSVSSLKTPKVDMRLEEGEDPDARFLEKMFLIDKALQVVDELFARFVRLRFSADWQTELTAIRNWVNS
jgi:hypothetical protein